MSFVLSLFGLSSPPPAKPKTDVAPPVQVPEVVPEADAASQAELQPESAPLPLGTSETPTDAAEVPVARKIDGAVDGFKQPGTFSGWALDLTNVSTPLVIQVLLDGEQIAAGATSFARPDLTGEAEGNTAGFRIDTDRNIDPEQIVQGRIEIHADGQPIGIWAGLIDMLKTPS